MAEKNEKPVAEHKDKLKCGVVMPISAIDGCSPEHWNEVLTIIKDAISQAGFEPNLVSDADDVGVIQKRIIQNLYSNEMVVCDVSANNPNVMFELGMRLAFDKPTVVIKDDQTNFSFDTSPIEHIAYPRDLRFNKILLFKEKLTQKIEGTHKSATTDSNYSAFLKDFGKFKVAKLSEEEVSGEKFILEAINDLRRDLNIRYRAQISVPTVRNIANPVHYTSNPILLKLMSAIHKDARYKELTETRKSYKLDESETFSIIESIVSKFNEEEKNEFAAYANANPNFLRHVMVAISADI